MTVTAFGKIEWNYGHRQMNSPDVEEGEPVGTGLVPVYGLTDGLHQRDVRCAVQDALRLAREDMSLIPVVPVKQAILPWRPSMPIRLCIFLHPGRRGKRHGYNWRTRNSLICSLASYCDAVGKGRRKALNVALMDAS